MDWLWTWGGHCFGYRNGMDLWSCNGQHIGRFFGSEVYGSDGKYIGEILSDDRLITNKIKKRCMRSPFPQPARVAGYAKLANRTGYTMYFGYEDFPDTEDQ